MNCKFFKDEDAIGKSETSKPDIEESCDTCKNNYTGACDDCRVDGFCNYEPKDKT